MDLPAPTILGGLPAHFEPEAVKANQAKADAIIEFAAKMKDWPLLLEAIDKKIEEQGEFIEWWKQNVSKGHGGDRSKISDRKSWLSAEKALTLTGISPVQVSRWRTFLQDTKKYIERQRAAAYRTAGLEPAENHRAEGTGENEWFTPLKYIEAAREVMGAIDLDPATHPSAQETIQAAKIFTRADDGLTQSWHGRIWLNPPYAQPLIRQFTEKLVEELSGGNATEAVLLTHNYTDTGWFHHAESIAAAVCFTRGRIKFVDIDGDECAPTQGQALFYYGEHAERFGDVFREFGFVR